MKKPPELSNGSNSYGSTKAVYTSTTAIVSQSMAIKMIWKDNF
mgnify:CR=1 FL=1